MVSLAVVLVAGFEHGDLVQFAAVLAHVAGTNLRPDHRLDHRFLAVGMILGEFAPALESGFFEPAEGQFLDSIRENRN